MRKGRRKRGDFAVASADAFEEPDKEMLTGFLGTDYTEFTDR